jgi:hypothetical protein
VTEPFRFVQAVGRNEDSDASLAQRADQLVDLAGGHRVETGGGLVEKKDRRVVEKCPGQRHPLAQPFGERTAGIVGAVGQVDRSEGPLDPGPHVG